MKKYLLTPFAAAALMLASCTQEEFVTNSSGDGNVTFSVTLPSGINTRAYSDGKTATQLTYALYDEDSKHISGLDGEASFNDLKATISLDLVTGKTYTIALWADAKGNSHYTFDKDAGEVSVDPEGDSQDETRDAFFASYTFTVNGAISDEIKLTRPFTQINIGTSDLELFEKAGGSIENSGMTVKGFSTLNLLTGEATDEVTYTFNNAGLASDEDFPYESDTYTYLVMDYVLMSTDKQTVDVTWTSDNAERPSVTFNSIPVQRNYRTNIFGALLTNPAEFDVVIKPGYDGLINQTQESAIEPQTDADGVYMITSIEELLYIAENPTLWKGKTIKLMNNLNLQGMSWKPIGFNKDGDTSQNIMDWFEGTFDGNNKTISNFTCYQTGNFAVAGLFGALRGNIKNLYVSEADIKSDHYAGALVAYSHQNNFSQYNGTDFPTEGFSISGCRVNNSTIVSTPNLQSDGTYDNGDKAGALIGYVNSFMTIEKCEARNNTIEAYRDLGGLIGYIGGTNYFTITINNYISIGNTIKQHYDNGYKPVSAVYEHIGDVYGWKDKEPTISDGNNYSHSNQRYIYNMTPTTAEELAVALRNPGDGTTITLVEGTYDIITSTVKSQFGMKLDGTGVSFKVKGAGRDKTTLNADLYAFPKCSIVFEDMKIALPTSSYCGFMNYSQGEFNNIDFTGCLWTWGGDKVEYNNCTFDGSDADIYPLWVKLTADATFNDCKLTAQKGRGILMCGDADYNAYPVHNVTLNNFEFNVLGEAKDKASFEIHTEADADNITGTISLNNVTYPEDKFPGGLWREIENVNETPTQIFNVFVDGKQEQVGRQ